MKFEIPQQPLSPSEDTTPSEVPA